MVQQVIDLGLQPPRAHRARPGLKDVVQGVDQVIIIGGSSPVPFQETVQDRSFKIGLLAPWSWDKFVDMLKHLWIPVIVIALDSTAGSIRTTRANVLDELNKPYVETARAKGVKEGKLVWKYPVRVAMNPFFSTVGWTLAGLISGQTLVAVVLSLQTNGPMMLRALRSQDMYLAGSFLFLLSVLTVIGTLISDILLAWIDPRIRMEG